MSAQPHKDLPQRFRTCIEQYEQVKARIGQVGFICEGSLTERRLPCGKKNCGCRTDPRRRHGPYYQLSWKEKGKTVSRYLPPEQAQLYREWIDNRRTLAALVKEMQALSRKAADYLLKRQSPSAEPGRPGEGPQSSRKESAR